jgi:hypothetical protein
MRPPEARDGSRRWLSAFTAALALAAGACGTEPLPEPELLAVCQARFPEHCTGWLYAGERLPMRILGTGLHAGLDVDLGHADPPQSPGRFELEVGGLPIPGPALLPGSTSSLGVLFAVLPAELPVGAHGVWVRTPAGLEAELADGLEVRSPLRLRASLARAELAIGERSLVTLEAWNDGLGSLADVALELTASPAGRVALGAPPDAFQVGPEARRSFQVELEALAAGQVSLALTATGRAGTEVPLGAQLPAPLLLEVR